MLLSPKLDKQLDHVGDDEELSDPGTNIHLFCLLVLMVLRVESRALHVLASILPLNYSPALLLPVARIRLFFF